MFVAAVVVLVVTTGLVEVAVVVTAELGEAAALIDGKDVVAAVVVLAVVIAGLLEATFAIRAVDVEATRAGEVLVETEGEDVAST